MEAGLIAAAVSLVIFVLERVFSRFSKFKEKREAAFFDIVTAFSKYGYEAIMLGRSPNSEVAISIEPLKIKVLLLLGNKHKPLVFWISGMFNRLVMAAAEQPKSQEELLKRAENLGAILENLSNTLVDIHSGILTEHDMLMPGSLFWAETLGLNIDLEFPEELDKAMRPRSKGKLRSFRSQFVIDFFVIPWISFMRYLGFIEPFGWVDEKVKESLAKNT